MGIQQYRFKQRYYGKEQSDVGNLARDAQELVGKIPVVELRMVETLYSEPMTLGQLLDEPFGIELVRVINMFAPSTPVKCGGMVHFIWKPENNGAVITSIDGMSPVSDAAIRFRFYYRITFKLS
jgi:hypothetical protein